MAVVRLDAAGQPDTTFAPGGGAVLRLADDSTVAVGVAQQADGKLVVAGWLVTSGNEGKFFIARLGGTCGNGVIDAPEQCDDGNTGALDCCTPGCALVPSGGTCEFDGNACTSDTCDGAGTCSLGGPRSLCRAPSAPGKAKLAITDSADATHDKLEFKWTKGVVPDFSVFGFPSTFTSYRLCIFAGPGAAPPLVYEGAIPVSSLWSPKNYKYLYKDKTGANDGFVLGLLQAPPSRPAKVVLKAKGANVAPPAPVLATPVTAQLLNTSGECFGATFATPSVNAAGKFRASGQ
jgi:cysteine-rich repeat protein